LTKGVVKGKEVTFNETVNRWLNYLDLEEEKYE